MYTPDPLNRQVGVEFKNGTAEFRIWAPFAKSVSFHNVSSNNTIVLKKENDQYWFFSSKDVKPGNTYRIQIDDNEPIPDPASLFQEDGVHGPSKAINLHDFNWKDSNWKNPPLKDYIIYELHTGLFSKEGNFEGIESRLNYLLSLGITAIEIMPVAQFSGARNWGYDGVFPFAVQNSYGGPEGLLNLVQACHQRGLAVILDVVYNHIGPEGNYFRESGPWFTNKYHTPWGEAINFDDAYCDGVRNYFIENALMWFRDYHIDALRLDAVHAIKDFGSIHILEKIKRQSLQLAEKTGREYHLIVECDLNDPRYIQPFEQGGFQMDAQWSDEFHHALRVCAGLEKTGYYSDFEGINDLAKIYTEGYVYTGEYSSHRKKAFGKSAKGLNGSHFVVFSQNHDQTGNRMLGERSSVLHGLELCKVMAAAVLLSPFIPLLFMGEEYAENTPFYYFVNHSNEELNRLVSEGRKAEFKAFHSSGETPDPISEKTYEGSRLSYNMFEKESQNKIFTYYQKLIQLRKTDSALKSGQNNTDIKCSEPPNKMVWVTRKCAEHTVHFILNFSDTDIEKNCENEFSTIVKLEFLLDSSNKKWGGSTPDSAPDLKQKILVHSRSTLIFREYHA